MLGDSCPYDHGRDPVIVDDQNIPGILRIPGLQQPAQSIHPVPDFIPNIHPMSVPNIIANHAAPVAPSLGLTLNTGLTLVPGQQRPVPTPTEIPVKIPILAQPQPALAEIKPAVEEVKELVEDNKAKEDKGIYAVCLIRFKP